MPEGKQGGAPVHQAFHLLPHTHVHHALCGVILC